ncbi:unnamed protein product, partial [marine sediment metagenome]
MNSMNPKENSDEIEKLSQVASKIQNIYHKKLEQLDELRLEIDELKQILNDLNSTISDKSFHSADEIYFKSIEKIQKKSYKDYFTEEIPKEQVKGTTIKRKIFSTEDGNKNILLCVLNYIDMENIEIKFVSPQLRSITETSEDFIKIFLKGALVKLKENNPNLSLSYEHLENSEDIKLIRI